MAPDHSDKLLAALEALEELADAMTTVEAVEEIDDVTLQMFWRDWPQVSSWAGALWRTLERDLAQPSTPADPDVDEIGGSG